MDGREITECNLKGPLALVIGGEDRGVSRLVKENCDGAGFYKNERQNKLAQRVGCVRSRRLRSVEAEGLT